jgi:hypothetical protein
MSNGSNYKAKLKYAICDAEWEIGSIYKSIIIDLEKSKVLE